METKVYVVGFESNGSVSFWDWYLDKKSQDDRIKYLKERTGLEKLSGEIYYGDYTFEKDCNIDFTDDHDVNNAIEFLLEEDDWENAFPHNPNIIL